MKHAQSVSIKWVISEQYITMAYLRCYYNKFLNKFRRRYGGIKLRTFIQADCVWFHL